MLLNPPPASLPGRGRLKFGVTATLALSLHLLPSASLPTPFLNPFCVLRGGKGKAEGCEQLPLLFNTHHFVFINLEAAVGLHKNSAEFDVFGMSAFVLRGKHQLRGYTSRE